MDVSRLPWKLLAALMVAVMLTVSLPAAIARAGLIPTDEVVGEAASADRARVLAFLGRAEVREQMVRLGIDPEEAAARVASLSDAEVRHVNGYLDRLPAGQNAVGAIVGAAVLIFVILLITDLLGWTDVFPFVKKKK